MSSSTIKTEHFEDNVNNSSRKILQNQPDCASHSEIVSPESATTISRNSSDQSSLLKPVSINSPPSRLIALQTSREENNFNTIKVTSFPENKEVAPTRRFICIRTNPSKSVNVNDSAISAQMLTSVRPLPRILPKVAISTISQQVPIGTESVRIILPREVYPNLKGNDRKEKQTDLNIVTPSNSHQIHQAAANTKANKEEASVTNLVKTEFDNVHPHKVNASPPVIRQMAPKELWHKAVIDKEKANLPISIGTSLNTVNSSKLNVSTPMPMILQVAPKEMWPKLNIDKQKLTVPISTESSTHLKTIYTSKQTPTYLLVDKNLGVSKNPSTSESKSSPLKHKSPRIENRVNSIQVKHHGEQKRMSLELALSESVLQCEKEAVRKVHVRERICNVVDVGTQASIPYAFPTDGALKKMIFNSVCQGAEASPANLDQIVSSNLNARELQSTSNQPLNPSLVTKQTLITDGKPVTVKLKSPLDKERNTSSISQPSTSAVIVSSTSQSEEKDSLTLAKAKKRKAVVLIQHSASRPEIEVGETPNNKYPTSLVDKLKAEVAKHNLPPSEKSPPSKIKCRSIADLFRAGSPPFSEVDLQTRLDQFSNQTEDSRVNHEMGRTTPLHTPATQVQTNNLSTFKNLSEKALKDIFYDFTNSLLPDENGNFRIHLAVLKNDSNAVLRQCLLLRAHRRSVDIINRYRETPLQVALHCNLTSIVKLLLKNGANPNVVDAVGNTVLHIVVEKGSLETLNAIFLSEKFKSSFINATNDEGFTPLHLATRLGKLNFVQLLVDRGAEVDFQDVKSGRTALCHAILGKQREIELYLQANGADMTKSCFDKTTPLSISRVDAVPQTIVSSTFGEKIEPDLFLQSKKINLFKLPVETFLKKITQK